MLRMAPRYGMIIIMSIYIICPPPDHNEQHLELHVSNCEDFLPLPSLAKSPECLYLPLIQDRSLGICEEHLLNT